MVITHQGALTSYYLGVSDGVVHQAHTFLFSWPYVMGISTAVLVPEFNILLLGGVTSRDEGERIGEFTIPWVQFKVFCMSCSVKIFI